MTMKPKDIVAGNELMKRGLIATFSAAQEKGFKEPFAIDITDNRGNTLSYTMSESGEISSLQEAPGEDSCVGFPLTVTLTDRHGRKLRSEFNPERTH